MAVDFTVIQAVPQRFGDATPDRSEGLVETEAAFIGKSNDFPFSCPNVLGGEWAVLNFRSRGVSAVTDFGLGNANILQINGVDIPGGMTRDPVAAEVAVREMPLWTNHSLLVPPNVLKEENVLHIESVRIPQAACLDNFIIDNIVLFFKAGPPKNS
jgi:hypothetical protein